MSAYTTSTASTGRPSAMSGELPELPIVVEIQILSLQKLEVDWSTDQADGQATGLQ